MVNEASESTAVIQVNIAYKHDTVPFKDYVMPPSSKPTLKYLKYNWCFLRKFHSSLNTIRFDSFLGFFFNLTHYHVHPVRISVSIFSTMSIIFYESIPQQIKTESNLSMSGFIYLNYIFSMTYKQKQ